MSRSAAAWLCAAALLLAAACPRRAAAQRYPPQARRYLLTTDAVDERAAWVNPAGLARSALATIGADLAVGDLGGNLHVSQYGASLLSGSLAAGWEHDRDPGGPRNTYVLATGFGDDFLSLGVAHRWHEGGQGAWDLALRGRATPLLDLSVVWRSIGSPVLADSTIERAVVVPAAGIRLWGGRFTAGIEADVAQTLGTVREVRGGATLSLAPFLAMTIRGKSGNGAADPRAIAVAIEIRGQRARGTFAGLVPAGAGGLETLAASGALISPPAGRRRR